MTSRNVLEFASTPAAGIRETVGNYHWVRVLNAFEMYVSDSDKSVSPHLINDGYWESWITTWVTNNIRAGDVFWDIGANTGYYGLLASYLGAQVHAFEPNPVYADMLRATAKRHGLGSRFRISEIALSDYHGEATLHIPTELHGSASLHDIPGYETNKVTVTVRPFPESAGAGRQVIKIDAEGEEERILRGAKSFLDSTPHKLVLLEYTPGAYSPDFLDGLFRDWAVTYIDFDGSEQEASPEWVLSQTDWVMLVLHPKRRVV